MAPAPYRVSQRGCSKSVTPKESTGNPKESDKKILTANCGTKNRYRLIRRADAVRPGRIWITCGRHVDEQPDPTARAPQRNYLIGVLVRVRDRRRGCGVIQRRVSGLVECPELARVARIS